MDKKRLKEIGKAIHGKNWRRPLARDLGIHRVTLWRYVTGDNIPKHIELAVKQLEEQNNEKCGNNSGTS